MALSMTESVRNTIRVLQNELGGIIAEMKRFVEHCETACLVPVVAEGQIASSYMARLAERFDKKLIQLDKYKAFDRTADEVAATAMDQQESVADQLIDWMSRKGITVAEAAQKFNRSKSTIYRWIKAGKLAAAKRDRRWIILAV